jgi:hypothetical protein
MRASSSLVVVRFVVTLRPLQPQAAPRVGAPEKRRHTVAGIHPLAMRRPLER